MGLTRTNKQLLGVTGATAFVAALSLLLDPTSHPGTTAPRPEPSTAAAAGLAARDQLDAYTAGDYGQAYDAFDRTTRSAITRADWLRLHALCVPAAEGIPIEVTGARLASAGSAVIRATRMGFGFTYTATYEDGGWHLSLEAAQLQAYRTRTVEQLAAEQRADGQCAPDIRA